MSPQASIKNSNLYGIDFDVLSETAYFVNVDTNTVVFAKNENKKIPAAALAKMMTISLILDSIQPEEINEVLNRKLVAKQNIFDRLYHEDAANSDIQKGEEVCK